MNLKINNLKINNLKINEKDSTRTINRKMGNGNR